MIAFRPLIPRVEEQYMWSILGLHHLRKGLGDPLTKEVW